MSLYSGNRYIFDFGNKLHHSHILFKWTGNIHAIAVYSYPLFMMVEIILKRSLALTIFDI